MTREELLNIIETDHVQCGEAAALARMVLAYFDWQDKTAWVQTDKRFDVLLPWGKHRADVLKEYIEYLENRITQVSEPVATLDVQSGRPDGNKFALVFSSAAHKLPDDVYFLYRHAQPAPVAPEEMTIRDACKFVQDIRLFDDVSVIVMRTWNACRATMLNGANHVRK